MKYLVIGIKRIFDFKGRSSRTEYWLYQLSMLICLFPILPLIYLSDEDFGILSEISSWIGLIYIILWVIVLTVSYVSISVRRLHDFGRSGWWILLDYLPLIGFVAFICRGLPKGDSNPNKYGKPSPY